MLGLLVFDVGCGFGMIIVDFVVWVVLGFVIGVELIDDVLSLVCVEV